METDTGFNSQLDRTLALLRAGQLDAGAPAAAEILRLTESEAKSYRQVVWSVKRSVR